MLPVTSARSVSRQSQQQKQFHETSAIPTPRILVTSDKTGKMAVLNRKNIENKVPSQL